MTQWSTVRERLEHSNEPFPDRAQLCIERLQELLRARAVILGTRDNDPVQHAMYQAIQLLLEAKQACTRSR